MSLIQQDIFAYGSQYMLENDTDTTVGGAIDLTTKVSWQDLTGAAIDGNVQILANTTATANVTVHGRNPAGEIISETKALNNTTPVAMTANTQWNRLMKAVRAVSGNYHVAVVSTTVFYSGQAQAGTANSLTLPAGANATNDYYQFRIGRITSDAGGGAVANHLFEITSYNGTSKVAQTRPAFSGTVGTPHFILYDGMLLDAHPTTIMTCRRCFYNVAADVTGGSARDYYEKFFLKNNNASSSLTTASVIKYSDPTGYVSFVLTSGLNDTGTNGANTRLVAPTTDINGAFSTASKSVPNSGNHSPGSGVAVWLKLSLPAGATANNTAVVMRESGQTT